MPPPRSLSPRSHALGNPNLGNPTPGRPTPGSPGPSARRRRIGLGAPALLLAACATGGRALAATAIANTDAAAALPPELLRDSGPLRPLGSATQRFFGISIYTARLWAPADFQAEAYARSPLALELQYFRSLSGKAIAERSLQEMLRQGPLDEALQRDWLAAMLRIFPDVQEGDRIVGAHGPDRGARFWHNGQARPELRDTRFSQRFFGIWLSEASSEPAMRSRLLATTP